MVAVVISVILLVNLFLVTIAHSRRPKHFCRAQTPTAFRLPWWFIRNFLDATSGVASSRTAFLAFVVWLNLLIRVRVFIE